MKYWHFLPNDGCMRFTNEKVISLHTYMIDKGRTISPCIYGFHASERAFDALKYAPGSLVSRVSLHGMILPHGNPVDKYVAEGRTHLWIANAEDTLRQFARWCALSVISKWNAPQVVIDYLNTGDKSLRAAAEEAAWASAWASARGAREAWASAGAAGASARAAEAARTAAWASAGTSAWEAARAAEASMTAVWESAREEWAAAGAALGASAWTSAEAAEVAAEAAKAAEKEKQNAKLHAMLMSLAPEGYNE